MNLATPFNAISELRSQPIGDGPRHDGEVAPHHAPMRDAHFNHMSFALSGHASWLRMFVSRLPGLGDAPFLAIQDPGAGASPYARA